MALAGTIKTFPVDNNNFDGFFSSPSPWIIKIIEATSLLTNS